MNEDFNKNHSLLRTRLLAISCITALLMIVVYIVSANIELFDYLNDRKLQINLRYAIQHGINNSSEDDHRHSMMKNRAWKALEIVDGLRNKDVVIFITSTAKDSGVYLRERLQFKLLYATLLIDIELIRIIPSARTWMKLFANTFVMIEDTFDARYSLRHCNILEVQDFTSFVCPSEPTYVLSRKCKDDYYGHAGPCCKVDEIMSYLIHREDIFLHMKFMLHGDDDTFYRADQVMRWLAAIDNSGINHLPIASSAGEDTTGGVWHIIGCKEIHTHGWYQPMMFNRAALRKMKSGVTKYGITQTCKEFDVTHDVGVGVFAWFYELYHITMPMVEINGNHLGSRIFRPDLMVVHGIRHANEDKCNRNTEWPDKLKYSQNVAIGCGDVDTPGPFHNPNQHYADMYDAWNYYNHHRQNVSYTSSTITKNLWSYYPVVLYPMDDPLLPGQVKTILPWELVQKNQTTYNGQPVIIRYLPNLFHLYGYNSTQHSKRFNVTEAWAPFGIKDCQGGTANRIDHRRLTSLSL